jgi:hypothetical protein
MLTSTVGGTMALVRADCHCLYDSTSSSSSCRRIGGDEVEDHNESEHGLDRQWKALICCFPVLPFPGTDNQLSDN